MTNLAISNQTDPQVDEVITLILDGLPLREAVKRAGLSPQAFHRRLANDREAAVAYGRAVEIKADLMADEVISLADGDGDPAKVRNQMNARQWLASKLYAKRYGDRIDLNVTQTLDIGATLAEARARLLPARDLVEVVDIEARENTGLASDGARDIKSLAPMPNQTPDIFS